MVCVCAACAHAFYLSVHEPVWFWSLYVCHCVRGRGHVMWTTHPSLARSFYECITEVLLVEERAQGGGMDIHC